MHATHASGLKSPILVKKTMSLILITYRNYRQNLFWHFLEEGVDGKNLTVKQFFDAAKKGKDCDCKLLTQNVLFYVSMV